MGEDVESTILTYDDYARKLFDDGTEYGTFNSYTVLITGDGFEANNITFENSAGSGKIKGQALAAYVDADHTVFRNCHLKDTRIQYLLLPSTACHSTRWF